MVDIKKIHFANFFNVFENTDDMQNGEVAFDSDLRLVYKDESGVVHPILSVKDYANIYNPEGIELTQTVKSATVGVGQEGDYSDRVTKSMPLSSVVKATGIHERVMLVQYDKNNNFKDVVVFPEYFAKLGNYADEIDINKGVMTEYIKKNKITQYVDKETLSNNNVFKICPVENTEVWNSLGYPMTTESNRNSTSYRDHIYIGSDNYLYVIKNKTVDDLQYPFWVLNRRTIPVRIKIDTSIMLLEKEDKFVFDVYRRVSDNIVGNSYKFIRDEETAQIVEIVSAVKTTSYGRVEVQLTISADKKSVIGIDSGAYYNIVVATNETLVIPELKYKILDIQEGFFGYLYSILKDINDNEQQVDIDTDSLAETVKLSLLSYLDEKLNSKANLESPEFTGEPKAPTPPVNDNSTRIATTAFVLGQAATQSPLMDGTEAVGTSTKFAREDHRHPTDTSRAPIQSPAFSGTPTAPTPPVNDNSTRIATTAFVLGQAGSSSPLMDGQASAGTSGKYAREDHRHPTDTSRAPVNNPVFTGLVTTPDIDVKGHHIYNVRNLPAVNILLDSGRFMGYDLDPTVRESSKSFTNNTDFFTAANGGSISSAGKFINNNTDNGGSAGYLTQDVKDLVDRMSVLANKNKRYGAEFHVLSITQGSGTTEPHPSVANHYLLFKNDYKIVSGAGQYFTFSFWIKVKSGSLVISKSSKLYMNAEEVSGDYLTLTPSNEWTHIQTVIYTTRGYDHLAPYLYATSGSVVQLALPVLTLGGTGVGIHSSPIPRMHMRINAAPPDSPNFTGIPTAPTAPSGTNTNQIATTAFVQNELSNYLPRDGSSPMTGQLILPASTTEKAPLNIPHGDTPSSPQNGDIWTTTSGLVVRINGNTRTLAHTSQWSLISQSEAEAGTATTSRLISAQRINQAIQALSPVKSVAGKTGDVSLTKADVGLENVTNESKATMFTSPQFTGIPTAPTAQADTNTNQIATTAFVLGQAATQSPLMDGTAAVGTSTRFAREDHRHPTDTSRAPVNNPTFTGNVVLPATTTIGDVTSDEIAHLDGVTNNIQEQLDSKAPINSPNFTGNVSTDGDFIGNSIKVSKIEFVHSGSTKFVIEYNNSEQALDFVSVD